jgi:hypothetical protein
MALPGGDERGAGPTAVSTANKDVQLRHAGDKGERKYS